MLTLSEVKSAGAKTPQPTPEHLSSQSKQGPQELIDTPERISRLRGQCLARDHYRCVISRAFDYQEASEQLFKDLKALDDEGSQLKGQGFDILEVAHIIPHSLAQVSMNSNLVSKDLKQSLYSTSNPLAKLRT